MTNYEQMKEILLAFADDYNQKTCIEAKISDVSEDKAETVRTGVPQYVYEKNRQDMDIIDMDEIAHNINQATNEATR